MKSGIKAVFFDIGGTLMEKTPLTQRDTHKLEQMLSLLQVGWTLPELEETIHTGSQAYKRWCEQTLNELSVEEKWARFLLINLPEEKVRPLAPQLQWLWSQSKTNKQIKNNALETMRELSRRGYLLGTISHSNPIYLDQLEFTPLLKVRIYAQKYGKRKPHPSLFMDAARSCDLSPEECAYVGDHPWRDVVGPREAGYGRVILMKNGHSSMDPVAMQPDMVIDDLGELLMIFPEFQRDFSIQTVRQETRPLYDIALSTMWWDKERMTAAEFFRAGREMGFARFELNHQIPPEYLEDMDLQHFSIGSLHDPCPAYIPAKMLEQADIQITSTDETLRHKAVDGIKKTLDFAIRIHARHVVIHPGRIPGDHSGDDQLRLLYRSGRKDSPEYEEIREKVVRDRAQRAAPHLESCLKSLREIVAFAEGSGLTLGLENRYHYYELPLFEEMQHLLHEFQQPWLGWQYDLGHLHTLDQLGLQTIRQWLEAFTSRIVGVHLHDVRGIQDHQTPGSGNVNFSLVRPYLPADCYHTLEVDKSLTKEDLAQALQSLTKSGCVSKI